MCVNGEVAHEARWVEKTLPDVVISAQANEIGPANKNNGVSPRGLPCFIVPYAKIEQRLILLSYRNSSVGLGY
jgi:hypothetical protein